MALAALLSAMKEIILDIPDLPEGQDERQAYIKKSFPKLSEHEAEDLAKIQPSKFKIYTNSIFSSERDLLKRNFAMTIETLQKYWGNLSNKPFNMLQLVKDLHKISPWKSTHTVDLGRNFVEYIKNDLKKIKEYAPFIFELAEMELLLRLVRRSPDDGIMPKNSLALDELNAMTVEALLDLNYQIPTCVEFTDFNYDLIEARASFNENDKKTPEFIAPKKIYCSLSRNRDALQRWTEYAENFYQILKTDIRGTPLPLAGLAEKFLETADQRKSEEDLFKEFLETVYRCVETGVLVIQK